MTPSETDSPDSIISFSTGQRPRLLSALTKTAYRFPYQRTEASTFHVSIWHKPSRRDRQEPPSPGNRDYQLKTTITLVCDPCVLLINRHLLMMKIFSHASLLLNNSPLPNGTSKEWIGVRWCRRLDANDPFHLRGVRGHCPTRWKPRRPTQTSTEVGGGGGHGQCPLVARVNQT